MIIKKRADLYKLLDEYNLPKTVAEIGVAEGRFSQEIYNNWGVDRLYLVDLWETMPFVDGCASFSQEWHDKNYENVIKHFSEKKEVTILKGFSHKMASFIGNETLGLVYIDSDHSYNGAKSDIQYWWPKLVNGGIMAFHDYGDYNYGVNRAVIEFVKGEVNVNRIEEDGKTENIGAWIRK
jgi:hypothetical protein